MPTPVEQFQELLGDMPMTQEELADAMDKARSTIGRWKRGQTEPSRHDMRQAITEIEKRLSKIQERITSIRKQTTPKPGAAKKKAKSKTS